MGAICCPERTETHSTSEPPLDHKSSFYTPEEEDIKEETLTQIQAIQEVI